MNIQWDASIYHQDFDFVPQYGESVMELLTADKSAFVIDVGCGNGTLTQLLADRGYRVIGVDGSEAMLEKAKADHPGIRFQLGDACEFRMEQKADAIFSNAVFHWIDSERQDTLIRNLAENLKENGELVFEFGGKGCAEQVHSTLEAIFSEHGMKYPRTFYFPTIGEYAPKLEAAGLVVEYAVLFDRPTPQKTERGLIDWINMFVKKPFENVEPQLKEEILTEAENRLRKDLYINGTWFIDYVRIRMRARKK